MCAFMLKFLFHLLSCPPFSQQYRYAQEANYRSSRSKYSGPLSVFCHHFWQSLYTGLWILGQKFPGILYWYRYVTYFSGIWLSFLKLLGIACWLLLVFLQFKIYIFFFTLLSQRLSKPMDFLYSCTRELLASSQTYVWSPGMN